MLQGYPNNTSFNYAHITTNTTTNGSTTGILGSIMVNSAGSAWVLTVKDGSNVIGVISPTAPGIYVYNVSYNNGLNVVTTGTTPGDATLTYL